MNRKFLFFILTISLLVLPTALMPVAAADREIEDGFEFVWNADTDIILYFPDDPTASPLLSVYDGDNTQLETLEAQFEQNAWRDVDVYIVEDGPREGLLAVRLTITWSTSSEAISFEDWRAEQLLQGNSYQGDTDVNFGLGLSATNNDSGNVVVDVLPDANALEGDVSRTSTDTGGSQYLQYKNATDIDVSGSLIIDFADYNYSSAKWIDLTGLRMDGAANATIDVTYAYSNGTLSTTQTNVFTTDQYLSAEDNIVKLPEPSATADNLGNKATYVAKINFTALELDEFRLFDFASEDYDLEGSEYVYDNDIPTLTLNGISAFSTWAQNTKNTVKLKSFSVKNTATKVTQTARGFVSLKASAIKAATTATRTRIKDVVDHEVVKARDKMSTPVELTKKVYTSMKDTYEEGEKNAQAMVREARKHLKAVQVTVGIKAEEFGEKADHAVDMTKETIAGIATSGGNAVSGATNWTKGIFDKAKDSVGRLKEEGAALFTKMSDSISSIGDNKKIIIAVVAVAVLAGALLLYKKD